MTEDVADLFDAEDRKALAMAPAERRDRWAAFAQYDDPWDVLDDDELREWMALSIAISALDELEDDDDVLARLANLIFRELGYRASADLAKKNGATVERRPLIR